MVNLQVPDNFKFKSGEICDFSRVLSFFDWNIHDDIVDIDLSQCERASYQSMSLIILYSLYLKHKGCIINFNQNLNRGLPAMWRRVGATGLFRVVKEKTSNFSCTFDKPLFFIRDKKSFENALDKARSYTSQLGIEYEKTVTYVLSELFYNALEHGRSRYNLYHNPLPAISQFCWYQSKNEIEFIVADLGIGIKSHLEQYHQPFENDSEAIIESLKPSTSGTFGRLDPYTSKNNAGMGLYISNNIIRKMHSEMYIYSGYGSVHITPMDITTKQYNVKWPGTFVWVKIKLKRSRDFIYESILSDIRISAKNEIAEKDKLKTASEHNINIYNFFGKNAEIKDEAIKYRDKYLTAVAEAGKTMIFNFDQVVSSPHSFLNALLALPIRIYVRNNHNPYKKIKIFNATSDIRETIDYIMDENTP